MKKILLVLLIAFSFSACEKDDICTEETTPRLILEFYDISNPANTKNVVSLKVKGSGAFDDLDLGVFSGESKIKLPLNPTATTTKYSLILNSANTTLANEDFIEFNYTTQTVYVSRACGYKTTYQLNNQDGVVQSNAASPDVPWIQNLTIQTNSITTENETHIKVYF
ncbi:hypothetical protein EZL74_09880 [Flavobacterium silvisoli]|uniref:DUF1735 domain-containing protein n=1 Tax=Flavobacterium silvisoli TaxID=2529433 RepID=A0A4Q9YV28_9FLAO|nr:DUF6452 family protein [Flavobacterium silvisoli]TBX67569.1 hypothetical protein EZL74_09880 [Flavobacterium silvisoli]